MGRRGNTARKCLSWCLMGVLVSSLWFGEMLSPNVAEAIEAPKLKMGESTRFQSSMVGPATRYEAWRVSAASGPQEVKKLQVNPADPNVALRTVLAGDQVIGRQTLSQMIRSQLGEGLQVIGGVNGDFFTLTNPPGIPSDVLVQDGQLVSSPGSGYAFGITQEGVPVIGKMQLGVMLQVGEKTYPVHQINHTRRENQLVLYTPKFDGSTLTNPYGTEVVLHLLEGDLHPAGTLVAEVVEVRMERGNTPLSDGELVLSAHGNARTALSGLAPGTQVKLDFAVNAPWDQVVEAIGGHPLLVEQGRIKIVPSKPSFDSERNPRTAVGITATGEVMFVTVDGRQPGYSTGVTIPELAQMMLDLGAVYALNLDGGHSTTIAVRPPGEFSVGIANRPSNGSERAISNALLVHSLAPPAEPTHLRLSPTRVNVLGGSRVQFNLRAQDQYYNPVRVPEQLPWSVAWAEAADIGSVSSRGLLQTRRVDELSTDERDVPAVEGAVAVSLGTASQTVPVRVVYEPGFIEVVPGELHLPPGGTHLFAVKAYDKDGQPLVADGGALKWQVEGNIAEVSERGYFQAGSQAGRGKVVATYGEKRFEIPVTVGEPVTFPDIEKSGVVEEIETLAQEGILRGYPDGTFRPLAPMSRAQLAKVLVLSAGWPEDPEAAAVFEDVTDSEQLRYVGALVARGIAQGTGPATFEPHHPLTRQQMASFFMRSMELEPLANQLSEALVPKLSFTDRAAIDPSHRANVALAVELGFITGIPNGDGRYRYEPLTLAKRQQVARLAYQFYVHKEQYLQKAEALKVAYGIE